MSETSHEHTWREATDQDLADYLAINRVAEPPPRFVRFEKCGTCSEHRVITSDAKTGEEVPHDPKYYS